MIAMSPTTVAFIPDEVSCDLADNHDVVALLKLISTHSRDPQLRARAAGYVADPINGADVHRLVLAARPTVGEFTARRLNRLLDQVRDHSPLYTPRRCVCLQVPRWQFEADTSRLAAQAAPDFTVWVRSIDGEPDGSDVWQGALVRSTPKALGVGWTAAGEHRTKVELSADPATRTLTATVTRHRARPQVVELRGLDDDRSKVVTHLRGYRADGAISAGWWVKSWPDAAVRVELADRMNSLLEAGFAALPGHVQDAAVSLAHGWEAHPRELVSTVRVVTASPGSH